jgi:hypothetical protein
MTQFWLNSRGEVIVDADSNPIDCPTCPCSECTDCEPCGTKAPAYVDATIPAGFDVFGGMACCPDIAGIYRLPFRAVPVDDFDVGCVFRMDYADGDAPCHIKSVILRIGPNDLFIVNHSDQTIATWNLADPIPGNCFFENYEAVWGNVAFCFSFLHQASAFLDSPECAA